MFTINNIKRTQFISQIYIINWTSKTWQVIKYQFNTLCTIKTTNKSTICVYHTCKNNFINIAHHHNITMVLLVIMEIVWVYRNCNGLFICLILLVGWEPIDHQKALNTLNQRICYNDKQLVVNDNSNGDHQDHFFSSRGYVFYIQYIHLYTWNVLHQKYLLFSLLI